jgi:hypothetical protein
MECITYKKKHTKAAKNWQLKSILVMKNDITNTNNTHKF